MFSVDIKGKMVFLQIKLSRTEDVAQWTVLAPQAGPGLNLQEEKQISIQKSRTETRPAAFS
jgi:hypothetical protein